MAYFYMLSYKYYGATHLFYKFTMSLILKAAELRLPDISQEVFVTQTIKEITLAPEGRNIKPK